MKKTNIFIVSLIFISMMIFTVSCGNSGDSGSSSGNSISIVMNIDFPDESGVADIEDVTVSTEDGSSVLDILNKYADENSIEIVTDGTGENPYVTSINGVSETDSAGWTYELNDEMVMDAADQCIVSDGDEIDWSFESWTED